MASSQYILCLLCLFSLTTFTSSLSSSTSTPDTLTIPLSPLFTNHHPSSSDPFHTLKLISSASISRAHHIKRNKTHINTPIINTPIHPKSYGGYSIDLKFGTPSQTFSFVLDTGSNLVWLPCSSRYLCSKCNIDPTKTPKFIPKNSSSSKLIGCKNPKCTWVFGPNLQCRDCNNNNKNCTQICPAYTIQYGLGSTAGFLLSENLNFPGKTVPDFLVGCSVMSMYQPEGIAGFGRGPESIPSQMGLKRFSYCLLSHRFDDSTASTELVLQGGSSGGAKTHGLSYAPFQKNPNSTNPAFGAYYYVPLRKLIVGARRVRVPGKLLELDSDHGNGGTIVDSGSTFTFMERPVFDLVAREFERQVNFTRAREVEKRSGLRPCFVVDGETASFPALTLQFRGGAKMKLPVENYFSFVGEKSDVACLTIVSDDVAGPSVAGGPAVILGNYQQQNFYIEYDLENQRFGFRSQSCKRSV